MLCKVSVVDKLLKSGFCCVEIPKLIVMRPGEVDEIHNPHNLLVVVPEDFWRLKVVDRLVEGESAMLVTMPSTLSRPVDVFFFDASMMIRMLGDTGTAIFMVSFVLLVADLFVWY